MLRFAEYNENETFEHFLNVQGIFERGELTARAGAKRSRSHRKTGLCYTTFMAKNGMRIQIETKCEKKSYTYTVSMNGKCSDPFKNRDEALKYIQVIGGYIKILNSYPQIVLEPDIKKEMV